LRGQWVSGSGGEAIEDGGGGFAVQLLIEDLLSQRMKGGLAKLQAARSDALDDRGQYGIGFLEVPGR
jgi:hypothetical protein